MPLTRAPYRGFNLMNLDWADWIYSLIQGFVGGGSAAVVSSIVMPVVDPEHFNLHTRAFYEVIGSTFLLKGTISVFTFLAQNPAPTKITTTTIEKTETQASPPATIVTKMEQTTTVPNPLKPPDK